MMYFSEVLASIRADGDGVCAHVPEEWRQGRAVFGGLQAAIVLAAMRHTMNDDMPLRSFQMTFIAPSANEKVQARAKILRAGKHTLHVQGELFEEDHVLATATAVFGRDRQSMIARLPVWTDLESDSTLYSRYVPGVTPTFLQHFKARWLKGKLPISGDLTPEASVIAELVDAGKCTEYHLLAFADFMPPMALSGLQTSAPGSSMTWMLEFLCHDFNALPLAGWRIDADMQAATGGYTSQSCVIWTPDRRPIALSRQTMVVFA